MADINVEEQRRCIVLGSSIVLCGITGIVSLCSEKMKFNIKSKQEIVFYVSAIVLAALFVVSYLHA